ncbi:MAG: transposase [Chromatiales bacterium]|nr:transposase [Chromatiales bacterium]
MSAVFIDFLARLLEHAGRRRLYLIVDGHPVHKSKAVSRWVAQHADRLRLLFLPGYAPELNPDELLNHDVKQAIEKARTTLHAVPLRLLGATRAGCTDARSSRRSSATSFARSMCQDYAA